MGEISTRDRLVQAGARLFSSRGYGRTSFSQLVREARSTRGVVSFHFPGGKEQLAAEAAAYNARVVAAALDRAHARHHDAAGAVAAFLAEMERLFRRSERRLGCPLAGLALELVPDSPGVAEQCDAAYRDWIGRIAGWLEQDGFDAEAARGRAVLAVAAIDGALVMARALQSERPLRRVREQLRELLSSA